MISDSPGDVPLALGFLTVVDQQPLGLVGGYLLVNAHARPLEFHCTVPVRPNRAQEILYGAALLPYLYGEQIGQTLVRTSKLRPLALFTDCPAALSAAADVDVPMWLVLPPAGEETDRATADATFPASMPAPRDSGTASAIATNHRLDTAHGVPPGLTLSRCGRNRLARAADPFVARASRLPSAAQNGDAAQTGTLDQRLEAIAANLDLCEPFERIRAAIQEAQRGAR